MIPRTVSVFAFASAAFAACSLVASAQTDPYGGKPAYGQWPATGFFRVEQQQGRHWLVTPDGNAYFSIGVGSLGPTGSESYTRPGFHPYGETVERIYGPINAHGRWADASSQRLGAWGFNTLGAWAGSLRGRGMSFAPSLALAQANWARGTTPDFFDPAWAAQVDSLAQRKCAPLRNDPWVLGYFTDNELVWGRDPRRGLTKTLVDHYLALGPAAPGKLRVVDFLRARHTSLSGLRRVYRVPASVSDWSDLHAVTALRPRLFGVLRAWRDGQVFAGVVAQRYFEVTAAAIRRHDPNHMILGCRFSAASAPREVITAAGAVDAQGRPLVDVVSVNDYRVLGGELFRWLVPTVLGNTPTTNALRNFHDLSGRPVLNGEFGVKNIVGHPVSAHPSLRFFHFGLAPALGEAHRVRIVRDEVERWTRAPYMVGYHWFRYEDFPAEGRRSDGDNSRFGLVTLDDAPYVELTTELTRLNQRAYAEHNR